MNAIDDCIQALYNGPIQSLTFSPLCIINAFFEVSNSTMRSADFSPRRYLPTEVGAPKVQWSDADEGDPEDCNSNNCICMAQLCCSGPHVQGDRRDASHSRHRAFSSVASLAHR